MFKEVLLWRMIRHGDQYFMYFDPKTECPGVRDLSEGEKTVYLDSVVSVSAVDRDRDQIDIQDGCEGPSREGLLPF